MDQAFDGHKPVEGLLFFRSDWQEDFKCTSLPYFDFQVDCSIQLFHGILKDVHA